MTADSIRVREEDWPRSATSSDIFELEPVRPAQGKVGTPKEWANIFRTASQVDLSNAIQAGLIVSLEDWQSGFGWSRRDTGSVLKGSIVRGALREALLLSRWEEARVSFSWADPAASKREVDIYRSELQKLRSEQRDEDRARRERMASLRAYVDEALALAHPIALSLLGWLYFDEKLDLQRVLGEFGNSSSAFEGVARLHFIGAIRYENGNLGITALGIRILEAFELVEAEDHRL